MRLPKRAGLVALCAAGAVALAGQASATTYEIGLSTSGPWVVDPAPNTGGPAFGLPLDASFTGSVTIDDATRVGDYAGVAAITAIDWVTGPRTWTLSDIDSASVHFFGSSVQGVALIFFAGPTIFDVNDVIANANGDSGVILSDPQSNRMHCYRCLIATGLVGPPLPIPEPTTWALMIGGFFGLGAALRRHRPVGAPV